MYFDVCFTDKKRVFSSIVFLVAIASGCGTESPWASSPFQSFEDSEPPSSLPNSAPPPPTGTPDFPSFSPSDDFAGGDSIGGGSTTYGGVFSGGNFGGESFSRGGGAPFQLPTFVYTGQFPQIQVTAWENPFGHQNHQPNDNVNGNGNPDEIEGIEQEVEENITIIFSDGDELRVFDRIGIGHGITFYCEFSDQDCVLKKISQGELGRHKENEEESSAIWKVFRSAGNIYTVTEKLKTIVTENIDKDFIRDCFESLAKVHERDDIHGDLSPGNVMKDEFNGCRFIDWETGVLGTSFFSGSSFFPFNRPTKKADIVALARSLLAKKYSSIIKNKLQNVLIYLRDNINKAYLLQQRGLMYSACFEYYVKKEISIENIGTKGSQLLHDCIRIKNILDDNVIQRVITSAKEQGIINGWTKEDSDELYLADNWHLTSLRETIPEETFQQLLQEIFEENQKKYRIFNYNWENWTQFDNRASTIRDRGSWDNFRDLLPNDPIAKLLIDMATGQYYHYSTWSVLAAHALQDN